MIDGEIIFYQVLLFSVIKHFEKVYFQSSFIKINLAIHSS